ncbi:hypothetical protein DSCO28_00880 [Desulfosarcina ovata subsp. sediminis]|uniref:Uncharacterized protein n=1 Tax=Desulfosarcina ovata subsp. sediminis TaxID=885957 RepID=A0A5K7ZC28_9BACT|nr:hypothetical protein DSCO28_00880 [Desulfosarcina ovata subsp. sediminis]
MAPLFLQYKRRLQNDYRMLMQACVYLAAAGSTDVTVEYVMPTLDCVLTVAPNLCPNLPPEIAKIRIAESVQKRL